MARSRDRAITAAESAVAVTPASLIVSSRSESGASDARQPGRALTAGARFAHRGHSAQAMAAISSRAMGVRRRQNPALTVRAEIATTTRPRISSAVAPMAASRGVLAPRAMNWPKITPVRAAQSAACSHQSRGCGRLIMPFTRFP